MEGVVQLLEEELLLLLGWEAGMVLVLVLVLGVMAMAMAMAMGTRTPSFRHHYYRSFPHNRHHHL